MGEKIAKRGRPGKESILKQKSDSPRTVQITFRIRRDVAELLEYMAKQRGMSPHELARYILMAYFKSKGYIVD